MNVLLQWYHLIFPAKWALLPYRKFNDKWKFIKLQIASLTSSELWLVNLLTFIQINTAFTLQPRGCYSFCLPWRMYQEEHNAAEGILNLVRKFVGKFQSHFLWTSGALITWPTPYPLGTLVSLSPNRGRSHLSWRPHEFLQAPGSIMCPKITHQPQYNKYEAEFHFIQQKISSA